MCIIRLTVCVRGKRISYPRYLLKDRMIIGSSPIPSLNFTTTQESCLFSVIPGVGLLRCGQIEKTDYDVA